MPFAIWCTTCPKPTIVGQGVRFNAEKKKVGSYHSTPIFSFRMKHNVCGGWIEIRTDPKNTAYVVTNGAKKRDTGESKQMDGDILIRTDEERERLRNDAFAALEVKIDDRKQVASDKSRIEEIHQSKQKDWEDPYAASKKLRRTFRADRKLRQKNEARTENLRDRMSLGMELLEETEEDRRRASFVEFGDFDGESGVTRAKSKPLFTASSLPTRTSSEKTNSSVVLKARSHIDKLHHELANNTRARLDPFLIGDKVITHPPSIIPNRGQKSESKNALADPKFTSAAENCMPSVPLVDYDSD